jgi:hypothetical protein
MNGKTKYNLEARQDLHKMNLRPELHPFIVVSLLFFKHVVSVAAYYIFYLQLNLTHFNVFAGRHGPQKNDAATDKGFLDAYRPHTV